MALTLAHFIIVDQVVGTVSAPRAFTVAGCGVKLVWMRAVGFLKALTEAGCVVE